MPVLQVGQPYIAGRASIAPRAEYNFLDGQHELVLAFSQLTEDEITAVRAGAADFGLLIYGLVIFFSTGFTRRSPGVMRRIRGISCQPMSGSP
jgi:hypothetical protein